MENIKNLLIGSAIGGAVALLIHQNKKLYAAGLPDYKPYASKNKGSLARTTQNRRVKYWEIVLPKILEIVHGHRLALVNYSKSADRTILVRNLKTTKQPIIVETNEINDFMKRKGKFLKAGTTAFNRGLVTLYVVFNNTGKNLRYINVDFDISDLSEKAVRPYILSAYMYFVNKGYLPLIVFTGSSWHLWAKKPDNGIIADYGGIKGGKYKGNPTGVVKILNELSQAIGVPMRGAAAHISGKITIDYSTNAANKPIRFPLSLHQKTGLASIPVSADVLLQFDPETQAHPDTILNNIDAYDKIIKNYFTFMQWKNGKVYAGDEGDDGEKKAKKPAPKKAAEKRIRRRISLRGFQARNTTRYGKVIF